MNTQVRYHQRRLADVAAALRLARTQTSREHGPRAQLAHHQQQRLDTVVRHAATHSPFYRRWLAKTGALGERPGPAPPPPRARQVAAHGTLRRARLRPSPAP